MGVRPLARLLAVAGMVAAGLGVAPAAANATTGIGCGESYSGYGELTACIGASGLQVRTSGKMDWERLVGGCSVEMDLVDNSNGQVIESIYDPHCRLGTISYGPMSAGENNNTWWYALLTVRGSDGTANVTSPVMHLQV